MALDRWIEVRVWIQVRKSRWLREVEGASGARWLWTIIQVKGNWCRKLYFPFVLCHLFIRIENGGLETRCRCFCVLIRSRLIVESCLVKLYFGARGRGPSAEGWRPVIDDQGGWRPRAEGWRSRVEVEGRRPIVEIFGGILSGVWFICQSKNIVAL